MAASADVIYAAMSSMESLARSVVLGRLGSGMRAADWRTRRYLWRTTSSMTRHVIYEVHVMFGRTCVPEPGERATPSCRHGNLRCHLWWVTSSMGRWHL